jgi:hypothetical protein
VIDAIKQAMGSFVSFTFSTKFLCGVNHRLIVIAVTQIQNHRQAFMQSYVAKCKYIYSVEQNDHHHLDSFGIFSHVNFPAPLYSFEVAFKFCQ